MTLQVEGVSKRFGLRTAVHWLERFEISDFAARRLGDLSKGNQQKVQFIVAVLHQPELLILDEPFTGLDPLNTELFLAVFREIAASGTTILFSSHRLDHVEALCDAVAILNQSRLVAEGRVDELIAAAPPQALRLGGNLDAIVQGLPAGCPYSVHRGLLQIPLSAVRAHELLRQLLADGGRSPITSGCAPACRTFS
ncbi:hypothetical protein GCM10025857_28620 [Alicyclobacillus contaminans]|nr:hypothetical protein GCM10025857_28620 [Alicyclobacillus contaminans]